MSRQPLPIDAVLPQLLDALRSHNAAVLRAPTGAGKTTRVPPALLESGLMPGRILLLEPRRLAARAAARRMADEHGSPLGDVFGYHVRFDRKCGRDTRVLAVTPGILLRLLHDDPYLESTAAVLFDEFHERGLDNDLALGLVRLVQQTVRAELRIVPMSATLAVDAVAAYLGGCPAVVSEGRLHPVEVLYEPKPKDEHWPRAVAAAVERLLDRTPGDVLAFLPGLGEIRQTIHHLEDAARRRDLLVLPLHGELPPEQQDAALLPQSRRRVVVATNVAETSVTVEGITGVVDSGLARVLVFDPSVGLDRLKLVPVSKSSADQRAGRAGRTQPGMCVRLWGEVAHRGRPEQTEPEVKRVDLAGAVLQLLTLGESDVAAFPWPDPPSPATVARAAELLRRFGAVDDGGLTQLGAEMARLPVHPRLGRLLVEGRRLGCVERAALAAALLSERDPFGRDGSASDLLGRVEALEAFEQGRYRGPELNRTGARFVLRARDQLLREVGPGRDRRGAVGAPPLPDGRGPDQFPRALLGAFPDRVARRRDAHSPKGVMVGGRGVRLAPYCDVGDAELFVCIDIDAAQGESLVRQASPVRREWLAGRLTTSVEVAFDPSAERVTASKVTRYEDLVIDSTPANLPEDAATARVLAEAASANLARVLPPDDSESASLLRRVRWLRAVLPELGLPAFDEAELRETLAWLCPGRKSFAELRAAPWLEALQGRLTHQQRAILEREAPERLEVPSGSRITLAYEDGRPPVLAVRIQELFGLADTPRLAGGRVKVLLHLLAPNYRPQQVTDDLASFWANTYPQVRKELRARYPRHAWPEDPLAADPERRPRRKS